MILIIYTCLLAHLTKRKWSTIIENNMNAITYYRPSNQLTQANPNDLVNYAEHK